MPTPFACSSTQTADQATLIIVGEVDLETAGSLRLMGEAALNDPTVTALVIDCHSVTFVDSTALSVFVAWSNEARSRSKAMTFQRVPRVMSRLMALTGLDQVLHVTDPLAAEERVTPSVR